MRLASTLLVLLCIASAASAEEAAAVWAALRGGGHVALVRLAGTVGGSGDPPGFKLEDCATQRNLTDKDVREDIAQGLVARELLSPAQLGTVTPVEAAMRYATLLKDHRSGSVAALPSQAFAPASPPSDRCPSPARSHW